MHPLILKSLQKCCLKAYVLLNYQFLVNLEFLVICLQTFQNEPDSEMLLLTFHMSNIDNTFPTNIMVIKINYQYEPGFNCHMFIVSLLQSILSLKTELLYDSAIPLLGIHLEKTKPNH